MVRISGVEIPSEKRVEIALTYIYGIGRKNVIGLLRTANVEVSKKVKDLNTQELARLQKVVDAIPTEGNLRKIVSENIKQLKQIGSYRGARHAARLPVRGQRTRSNARTKKGKRVTIGAMKKEMLTRREQTQKEKEQTEK